jgi:polyisoprenoid-binding protein YceI
MDCPRIFLQKIQAMTKEKTPFAEASTVILFDFFRQAFIVKCITMKESFMRQFLSIITLTLTFFCMGFVNLVMVVDYPQMPAGKYVVDKTHASLIWKISHLGLSNYTARFKTFDASFEFDPKHPEKSTLHAVIDPLSIETDYPNAKEKDFNKELSSGENWFNAAVHPKIIFHSDRFEVIDKTHGKAHGQLILLGVSKPLALDVTLNGATQKQPFSRKPTFGFSATASLKRSEWGMEAYLPNIGDSVDIQIEAEFSHAK